MTVTGLHLLLTYRCTAECDHCFVWGSPKAGSVFSLPMLTDVLEQTRATAVTGVYFEGGEPFLYYPLLLEGLRHAARLGLTRGVVTNCYWATSAADARLWLEPLAEVGVEDFSISADDYHGGNSAAAHAASAASAARQLGLPLTVLATGDTEPVCCHGLDPVNPEPVMYRGRAARQLAPAVQGQPVAELTRCPHEDLATPSRIHLDALGYLHLCQGLTIGRVGRKSLASVLEAFDPDRHPVVQPLVAGGPRALAEAFSVETKQFYADACHCCYEIRDSLRRRLPDWLAPGQMYGETDTEAEKP